MQVDMAVIPLADLFLGWFYAQKNLEKIRYMENKALCS